MWWFDSWEIFNVVFYYSLIGTVFLIRFCYALKKEADRVATVTETYRNEPESYLLDMRLLNVLACFYAFFCWPHVLYRLIKRRWLARYF